MRSFPPGSRIHVLLATLWRWVTRGFPRAFRRNSGFFVAALAAMGAGMIFGGATLAVRPEAKEILIPFTHLLADPAERVATLGTSDQEKLHGGSAGFWRFVVTNNIRVSILTVLLGLTWGVGTVMLLFYNGVILGAVILDYFDAGETLFLLGWLMPHAVVEVPAVLISGQAGLLLGKTLIGWGDRTPLLARLRLIKCDLAFLVTGVALLLVWAAIAEAFLSENHAPAVPYAFKIAFGMLELGVLILFLRYSGRQFREHSS